MKTYTFQEQINHIRKEALRIGFANSTMDSYDDVWKQFIIWKHSDSFIYNEEEYCKFLLEHYKFDINTYSSKSKSRFQMLMRSKRILDDFDKYKQFMLKRVVNNNLKSSLSSHFKNLIYRYKDYCSNVSYNAPKNIKIKTDYITNLLVFFEQKGLKNIQDLNENIILMFIKSSENKGDRSKSRYFTILRDFLKFLYDENIINVNYAYLVPTSKKIRREKIPTYIKTEKISELLTSFPRQRKIDKRNYAIILIAAELGMRVGDILNLKLENINWKEKKITFIQNKTTQKNILPLSNEIGWALIDYIKSGRPITKCRNIFVNHTIPYDEMKQFNEFSRYFSKEDIEASEENKNGIHNLRHSLAKRMLDNEIPLPIISETLGHATIETTRSYLKVDIERLKECSLEVDL